MLLDWLYGAMNHLLGSFDEYLRLERNRSEDTRKRYRAVAQSLLQFLPTAPDDDWQRLKNTTDEDVRAFLIRAAETKSGDLSGFMWNQKLAAVRTLFRFLVKRKVVRENPAAGIEVVEVVSPEKVPLTLTEFIAFLGAIEQRAEPYRSRDLAIAQVAFHCALRVRELHRLELGNLDFHNGYIINLRTKRRKYLLLPLPPLAAYALQRCISERARLGASPSEPAVFLSERGSRLSVRQMEELVPRYARQAGIFRRITPHYLRHSIATVHALLGTQPWDIQRLLNHDSLSTTERYLHTLQSLRAAMWAVDAQVSRMLAQFVPNWSQVPGGGAPPLLGSPSLPTGSAPFP